MREQAETANVHHDVVVLADDGPRARWSFELRDGEEHGLRVIRIGYRPSRLGPIVAAEYLAAVLAGLRRLAREGRPADVLHAHVYHAGVAAVIAGRIHGVPVVVSEHSSHFADGTLSPAALMRARLVFRAADLVCPVSGFLRDCIEARGLRGRFRVIPNGVDTELFTAAGSAPARDDEGRARVLIVSGLQSVKGVSIFLRAVAQVAARRRDFHVDVIGDGPERAACERLVTELGIGPHVTLHGHKPRADVAVALRRASFFALPSRTETFGVAAAEAMVGGRPVLAARVGALPELIDDDAGMLVDSPSEDAFAAGLDDMLDRFDAFDHARISARAVARFGRRAVARQWDEVYRGAVAARTS